MTDLITEVYSTLAYILEEIANNVNNISTKYLPALVSNVSPTLLFYIGISLVIFIVCIYPERKSVKTKSVRKKQKDDTLIAKPTIKTTMYLLQQVTHKANGYIVWVLHLVLNAHTQTLTFSDLERELP